MAASPMASMRADGHVDVLIIGAGLAGLSLARQLQLASESISILQIDKRLVQLRPSDPLAHYNLACSYALLKRPEQALKTLRRAVELGYRDFRYMREDRDLDTVRKDPRFRQLLREFESR